MVFETLFDVQMLSVNYNFAHRCSLFTISISCHQVIIVNPAFCSQMLIVNSIQHVIYTFCSQMLIINSLQHVP